MSILESTVIGPFQFEVALTLRAGILTNSEAWYGLRRADIENLEQIDEQHLRRILEVGSGCSKDILYLDIRFIITYRRIMILHYILNEDQESLIFRINKAQAKNQTINDWSVTVENDLKELGISQSNEEIKTLKKEKFAEIVKQAVEERA